MRKIIIISIIVISTLPFSACYYDKEQLLLPPKTGTTICVNYSFTNDVSPVFQTTCNNGSGCHGSGSSNGPGALVTYAEVKNASVQIKGSVSAGRMPLGSGLTSAQLTTITCWIGNGALNN